jgi:hypothetical protein
MSHSINDNNEIVIRSKRTTSIKGDILYVLLVIFFIIVFIEAISDKKILGAIACLAFCILILQYLLIGCKSKVKICRDSFLIKRRKSLLAIEFESVWLANIVVFLFAADKSKIVQAKSFKSVSKIKFNGDNTLVIYDLDDKIEEVLDLDYFYDDDIQLMINAFCRYAIVEIDNNLAREKYLKLPEYAISQENNSLSRKRNIYSEKTYQGDINKEYFTRENATNNNGATELSGSFNNSDAKKNNRRKLEL